MTVRISLRAARLAPAPLLLCLGGCATLDRGTVDDVPVVTQPPGAAVSSSTGTICTSPCTVSGPRDASFAITITKAGYASQSVTSEAKPDTAAIAAASALRLTPDALGRAIDVRDGTYYHHEPKAVIVKLVPTP